MQKTSSLDVIPLTNEEQKKFDEDSSDEEAPPKRQRIEKIVLSKEQKAGVISKCVAFIKDLKVTKKEQQVIVRKTSLQADSKQWFAERKKRITAS